MTTRPAARSLELVTTDGTADTTASTAADTPRHVDGGFAMTNLAVNRLLIPVLESKAGARLGRRLAVVRYVGRRSGRAHRLVAQYVTAGTTVRINVGMANRKTWWRNFESPHPIALHLAGQDHRLVAHVVGDGARISVVAEHGPTPLRTSGDNATGWG